MKAVEIRPGRSIVIRIMETQDSDALWVDADFPDDMQAKVRPILERLLYNPRTRVDVSDSVETILNNRPMGLVNAAEAVTPNFPVESTTSEPLGRGYSSAPPTAPGT